MQHEISGATLAHPAATQKLVNGEEEMENIPEEVMPEDSQDEVKVEKMEEDAEVPAVDKPSTILDTNDNVENIDMEGKDEIESEPSDPSPSHALSVTPSPVAEELMHENEILRIEPSAPSPSHVPNAEELMNEINEGEEDLMIQRLDDEVKQDTEEEEDDEEAIHEVNPDAETDAAITTEHSGTRDDRGQSVLHFAASRPGGASTILAFLQNPSVNLAWRDERLRTARDIAEGLSRIDNIQTIDSYIVGLVNSGDLETLEKLMTDGYDHILSVEDTTRAHIVEVAEKANHRKLALFLRSLPDFHEKLLKLHRVVRHGSLEQAKELLQSDRKLAVSMSPWGRCILHVAVLVEEHTLVQYLAQSFPECLRRGDNLERTALHYAMGIEKVEKMTRILVRAGAKRVVKDLRGRQPSYYFINRDEIAQLQREEEQLKLANA